MAKQHDRDELKQKYMSSDLQHVSTRARQEFGIKKGSSIPGGITKKMVGRSQEKKELSKLGLEEAQEEVKETQRASRVKVLNRANDMEMALIEHISDIVEKEIVKKRKGSREMSINKMDFILRTLRTVQGKANEYLGGEVEETSPLENRLREMGLLSGIKKAK